jgi:hypothetical protein
LMAALDTVESNGEDNVIRMTQGNYLTNGVTPFTYQAEDNQSLTLSGGWYNFSPIPNPCFSQAINPLDTVLDGNNLTNVMHLSNQPNKPNTDITIENLTISNGFSGTFSQVFSGSLSAPGLTAYFHPGHLGSLHINQVMFIGNNTQTASISALYNHNSYFTNITNSVFVDNESKDGYGSVYIYQTHDAIGTYFVNNTLINNIDNQTAANPYTSTGLFIFQEGDSNGAPQGLIANNLFWDNEHNDITAMGEGTYYLYNNNYQEREGVFADDVDNMSSAPLLGPQILDFTPQPGSPLINKGKPEPVPLRGFNFFLQGWSYGNSDFDGGDRVVNNRVDIGAVEALPEVPIFEDGFEG